MVAASWKSVAVCRGLARKEFQVVLMVCSSVFEMCASVRNGGKKIFLEKNARFEKAFDINIYNTIA